MHLLTIITLSTGDERYLTKEGETALRNAQTLILRTNQHPIVPFLEKEMIAFTTLDALYDAHEDFDACHQAMADHVLQMAQTMPICYAVSDAGMDQTVKAIKERKKPSQCIHFVAGVSHAQRCLGLLFDACTATRIYSATDFISARMMPSDALLLCELHTRELASECKLMLADLYDDDCDIHLFIGDAITGEMKCLKRKLYEMDRLKDYNHLTAAWIPAMARRDRKRYDMQDLVDIMKTLRAPDGCPWDVEQTHESLLTNLLEESYEYIQAVREDDVEHMYDELGDVLLQVVFHAEIARQHGNFDITDVTTAISQKMMERHPHIFGSETANTAEDVLVNWEAIKRKQRGITTHAEAMQNVSKGLSALMRANKVQGKAQKVHFDFATAKEALEKVTEETAEVLQELVSQSNPEEELGDLLFSVVNVCRLAGVTPDIALHLATEKFIRRFDKMENAIKNDGKALECLTLSEMDVYWCHGKCEE